MLYDKYRPTMLRSLLRLYTKELKALDSANRMKQRRLSIYMTYTNNGDNRVSTAYSTLSLRFFFFLHFYSFICLWSVQVSILLHDL